MSAATAALEAAATALVADADELTRLDALQGDGDLGRTAGLVAAAVRQAIAEAHEGDVVVLLRTCGQKIAAAAPSSSGTLIAGAFLSAAKAVAGGEGHPLTVGLGAAIEGIQHRGKAQPGDRTMLDALSPASLALQSAPDDHESAARAAEAGIEATRTMTPQVGRARFLVANASGEPDPGAVMVGRALAAALRAG